MSATDLPDFKRDDWRAEQLVDGEWIEVRDYHELRLVHDDAGVCLMRDDLEVGGPWRLFINDTLVLSWNPDRGQGPR